MEIAIYLLLGIIICVLIALIISNLKKITRVQSEKEAVQQKFNDLVKEFEVYKATLANDIELAKQEDNIHLKNVNKEIEKKFSKERQQLIHKNAYEKWTAEDDEKLEVLFCEGKKVWELSEFFKRNPGAIRSRIKKLELKEKYG